MDETSFTKLRITKGVNDGLKDLKREGRLSSSVAQLAEDFLLEAIEASTSQQCPPTLLPTVLKVRARLHLPIVPEAVRDPGTVPVHMLPTEELSLNELSSRTQLSRSELLRRAFYLLQHQITLNGGRAREVLDAFSPPPIYSQEEIAFHELELRAAEEPTKERTAG